MASALTVAHRNNVIHRDIKPSNILLDEDGNAYLSDFGIAKDLERIESAMTSPDALIGSPDYLSPEQARMEEVTPQTDIYSLGVVLYEMLSGEHPFPGLSPVEQLFKHLNEPLPQIANLDPDVSEAVNQVVQKATAKNPRHRYKEVITMAAAFREAAALSVSRAAESLVELLTPREQEVLKYIIEGKSNREIASQLTVELGTVKWYITQIYHKLNVRSRVQAIVRARELNLIVEGFAEPGAVTTSISRLPEPENPYKGLRAFQVADEQDFFGRERLTDRLIQRLREKGEYTRFLAVIGPSGSGKSSLVKAGLIPALWRGELPGSEKWYVVEMIPGAHPLDELEVALMRITAKHPGNLREQLERDGRGLIRTTQLILPNDNSELLLVIDQFEEVFTLVADEDARAHFLDLLHAAVIDPRSRVRVVITLRADFYDRPLHYSGFGELVRGRMETVLPLSVEELEQAIARPAGRVGVRFEEGLVARIIDDVLYQPGALPLLQYALTELFESRQNRKLTRESYENIGGAVGALATRAEEVHTELDEAGRETMRQMFLRLVTLGDSASEGTPVPDTRRRVPRSELLAVAQDPDLMDEIIDTFAAYRLLSLDHDPATHSPIVEVAHEAILREWERLRDWLNAARDDIRLQRQLAAAAGDWREANQDRSFLLRGSRLGKFEAWAEEKETGLALTPGERDFLKASLAERDREETEEAARQSREAALEQRSRNFLRALVGVFAVATLIALILTGVAFNQRGIAQQNASVANQNAATATVAQGEALLEAKAAATSAADAREQADARATQQAIAEAEALARATAQADAEREREIAVEQRLLTLARELAFASLNNLDIDSERSVLLALEAIETANILESTNALHQVLPELRILRTYLVDGYVGGIAFSPDGARLAGGNNARGELLVWDRSSGERVLEMTAPAQLRFVAYSPDGSLIAASGQTGQADLMLWDANSGELLRSWTSQPGSPTTFEGNAGEIAFSSDGYRLAVATLDGLPHVFDIHTGEMLLSLVGHTYAAGGLDYSPDGSRIATGDNYVGEIIVWDAETGEQFLTLDAGTKGIYSVAFSPDGSRLAAVGDEGVIKVWDVVTGEELLDRISETAGYRAVLFTHDGQRIITGGQDSTARVWDANTGKLLTTFAGHTGVVISLDLSSDGRVLASGGTEGSARLWDMNPGSELFTLPMVSQSGITLTPDGKTLVAYSPQNTINLLDPNSGTLLKIFAQVELGEGDWLTRFIFTPDGQYLIAGHNLGQVSVFDYASGEQVMTLEGHKSTIIGVDITSDGSHLVTSSFDGKAIVWNLNSGNMVTEYTRHTYWVTGVVFSPDDEHVMTASADGSVQVWDADTGETLATIPVEAGALAIAYSPDEKHIVVGTLDGMVIVFDAESWGEISRFQAQTSLLFDLAFSADGSKLITAGFEGNARVWEYPAGTQIATLYGHQGNVTEVEISPDGKMAYTGCWDGQLRAFLLEVDELVTLARARLTRDLTVKECQRFLHLDECPPSSQEP